jgi:hypothetical protein
MKSFTRERVIELWQIHSDNNFAGWLRVDESSLDHFHDRLGKSYDLGYGDKEDREIHKI